jgi:hypothetical protein
MTTAIGTTATTDVVADTYVTGGGAVYDLRYAYGGGLVERVRVVRLLGAVGPRPAETAAPAADRPRFAGKDAPTSIEVTSAHELPPATLSGTDARSIWWLVSLSRTDPYYGTVAAPGDQAYRLTATFADASMMTLAIDATVTVAGTARFGTSPLIERGLAHMLSRPAFTAAALRRYGAKIRTPDLPGTERALTAAEVDAFAAALDGAFATTFFERYIPLEDPFPRRQITIAYPAATVLLQDVGDRYLRTARHRHGAMVHDGRASALLRQWLPAPSFARDDPAVLYTAERVTLPDQDISRWKASIVRALVVPTPYPAQGIWDPQGPLVFTFTLPGGRTEVVRVDARGYSFAGRTYERFGLLDLHGLKGVP